MRKLIGLLIIPLLLATPVLAASLGISPSHTELEVPGNGSATANFQVYYFNGDLQISLVDIPLKVEPETIYIEPSSEPVDIQITIYGDETLGSQVYDGYVRFLGVTGGTVAVAVKVKAKITNVVEGQPLPEQPSLEEAAPEQTPPAAQPGAESFPIIPVAGIAAGTAIIITLIVVLARRRRY